MSQIERITFHALARSMAGDERCIPAVSDEIIAELESHIALDYRPVAERITREIPRLRAPARGRVDSAVLLYRGQNHVPAPR